MRIGKLPGNCEITGYEKGGWFPIEGFNFGFNVSMEELAGAIKAEKERKKNKENRGNDASQQTGSPVAQTRQTADKKKDDAITKMQISKAVDATTVYLMRHAMELPAPPGTATTLDAEIHVIGSMSDEEKTVYCQLRVYLQDVFIT
ncbi:MAG: hypothetical protein QGG71_23600, partial [Pirellulaceae bacterium]|nr:hypothetical protein [Pirellulaceae bacterium]